MRKLIFISFFFILILSNICYAEDYAIKAENISSGNDIRSEYYIIDKDNGNTKVAGPFTSRSQAREALENLEDPDNAVDNRKETTSKQNETKTKTDSKNKEQYVGFGDWKWYADWEGLTIWRRPVLGVESSYRYSVWDGNTQVSDEKDTSAKAKADYNKKKKEGGTPKLDDVDDGLADGDTDNEVEKPEPEVNTDIEGLLEVGTWIPLDGNRWAYEVDGERVSGKAIAIEYNGKKGLYYFDDDGVCVNSDSPKQNLDDLYALVDGKGDDSDEAGVTELEVLDPNLNTVELDDSTWDDKYEGSNGRWCCKTISGSWAIDCVGHSNLYEGYWAFNKEGWCINNSALSLMEAAKLIGGVKTQKTNSIKTKGDKTKDGTGGSTNLKVTNLTYGQLRTESKGALKLTLKGIQDSQGGKAYRGAAGFTTIGTEYIETKLEFSKETKIYTMASTDKKSTEICVIATRIDNDYLDLQVGGTLFKSFPYKLSSTNTIKLNKSLYEMLESCYIDIDQNNKADATRIYSYAGLYLGEHLLQYVYFMALSDDGVTSAYHTVPLFLFKINGNFIEVKASNANSGNQFSVNIPGLSQITIIKEGFLAKTEPIEIFDGCNIINPVVSNVNEIAIKELDDNDTILEIGNGTFKSYRKSDFNNIDLVSAYSIGNNVYITNNVNAVSLTNITSAQLNNLEDNKELYMDSATLYTNTTSTIEACYLQLLRIMRSYIMIVISIILMSRLSNLGSLLIRKKIDLIEILTFGRVNYMNFDWINCIVYVIVVFVIYTIVQVIYYLTF